MAHLRAIPLLLAVAGLAGAGSEASPRPGRQPGNASPVVWALDNLKSIGGQPVTVLGSPQVVLTPIGRALEFDGEHDGLLLNVNPIAGLARFTVEALIEPAPGGPAEQRFLHLSEDGTQDRAMLEIRLLPGGAWCLDTFLRRDPDSLTLVDRERTHRTGAWHAVALVYDGARMVHFVDSVLDGEGKVRFTPLAAGQTSIGVRQNRVSWFKGRMAVVRVSAEVLPPARLLKVPVAR